MRKLQNIMLLLACLLSTSLVSQSLLKKANKQFDLRAYDLAIDNYLQVINDDPGNNEVKLKLAESYRLSNQFIEAISWYERASAESSKYSADMIINYAHTLKNVGLYDKAQGLYQKYADIDQTIANHYSMSCDYAKEVLSKEDKYRISLMKFSTKSADFGVTFYNDYMVFCSFDNPQNLDQQQSKEFGNILYIENEHGDGVELLRDDMKNLYGIGPLSYSADNRMVAYTKNNFINGYKQVYEDEENMSIYYAITDENGDFAYDKPFPFNGSDYSTAFPHLSYNGAALYFASNKLGGFGGFDLYVSYLKNGEWTRPENLGPSINSRGNEITPFFDEETLYFASDYHQGLGGYDVFKSRVTKGAWSFAENMGKGVNSPADDYYFVKNRDSGEMFFSSNRLGGRGNNDIYVAFKKEYIEFASVDVPNIIDNSSMPQAVVLDDIKKPSLVINKSVDEAVAAPVTETTEMKIISEPSKASKSDFANMSLYGARKIALGEVVNTNSLVYFIQLAALRQSQGSVDQFSSLLKYGNLYKFYKPSATKIKLGYYMDRREAVEVLNKVKVMGYKDAFITNEPMNNADMELVQTSNGDADRFTSNGSSFESSGSISNYKIRLAAFENPLWFDVNEVKDLGTIEQWSKGSWTIFILSGYHSLEATQSALLKAKNRGYQDAEIVIDNNGILERLTRN